MGADYNVMSLDGSSFTAGGDFYWLKRSYTWIENGQVFTIPAESHGHNVAAMDYGLSDDRSVSMAPGGEYPAADLSCVSCHDPHAGWTGDGDGGQPIFRSVSDPVGPLEDGTAGNYRLLGGSGYSTSGIVFSNDAPVALTPVDWRETNDNHVDYGSGMSEWCANCHGSIFRGFASQHPAGDSVVFTSRTADAYNSYIRSGNFSGSSNSSYLALVPFERGVSDPNLLDPASTAGPEAGSSNVMCLTCHRAHASAFESIGRWDLSATYLAESHPRTGDGGASGLDARNSYYGRDVAAKFGQYQRSLCNKCHPMD
jgi:hypothetical protein